MKKLFMSIVHFTERQSLSNTLTVFLIKLINTQHKIISTDSMKIIGICPKTS